MTDQHTYILGPCAAETEQQLEMVADVLAKQYAGNKDCQLIYRCGIWKPRTSPDSFQGIGDEGLNWLVRVREKYGMDVATEVSTCEQVQKAIRAGINHLWIGARTSANPIQVQTLADAIRLEIGNMSHPIKGLWVKNPVNEDPDLWMGNIRRLQSTGIPVGAIHRGCNHQPHWAMAHKLRTILPDVKLLLDPSHMTGNAKLIETYCQRAQTLSYDGWMVEIHPMPSEAWSDAKQQITPSEWQNIYNLLQANSSIQLPDNELNWLRQEMDEVDDALWETIQRRMDVSLRIGEHKRRQNLEIIQPSRYQHILEKRKKWAEENGMNPAIIEKIMEVIHEESVRIQTLL